MGSCSKRSIGGGDASGRGKVAGHVAEEALTRRRAVEEKLLTGRDLDIGVSKDITQKVVSAADRLCAVERLVLVRLVDAQRQGLVWRIEC